MNSPETTAHPQSRRSPWRWVAVILGASALIVVVGLANVLTLNREAATLRRELFSELRSSASPRVQIDLGPGMLTLARGVVWMIDDVPPEARRALQAVRAASVGVYTLKGDTTAPRRLAMMLAADEAMFRRDWTRIVGINNERETVLVYTPKKTSVFGAERVCVAVCQDDQIVIVSAAVKRDRLLELLRDKHTLGGIQI